MNNTVNMYITLVLYSITLGLMNDVNGFDMRYFTIIMIYDYGIYDIYVMNNKWLI